MSASTAPYVLEADWTWTGSGFEPGVRIAIGADGRIAAVGSGGPSPVLLLSGRALLPGFVSAHSHAFQRGLRGRGEIFPAGQGSFWTWREAMYGLVERMDADRLHRLSLQTFRELRAAGVTTVGEFHYLHHLDSGASGYEGDAVVIRAAAEAGIRLVLLNTYYATGAIGQPLAGAQRRFGSPSPERFWEQMDRVAPLLDPRTQALGVAVHSIRAASLDDLHAVYFEARRRDLPVHMHVEEQRREIEDALAFYGRRPMELILDTLGTAEALTAVHCTHTTIEDLDRFLSAGGTACLCPLTEANLGDGIPHVEGLRRTAGALAIGTDSNARLSLLEEMRWLEYAQRLATETRGALRDSSGVVSHRLLDAATSGGARALGLDAGHIAPGQLADLVAIDLAAPALAGWEPATLLDALIFGAGSSAIAATCVSGRWSD